ncbi:hypothetical protein BHE74_00018137 [Ensete ventricosum]|nr:hypothetical protein BHE74_00018137 [Ensete ventricosum]
MPAGFVARGQKELPAEMERPQDSSPAGKESLASDSFSLREEKDRGDLDIDVATQVFLQDDGPKRSNSLILLLGISRIIYELHLNILSSSLLYIETADRPGLLLEIIKIITDINIDVESAEIDTEVLTNCLRYYLRRPETDEESY